MLLRFLCLPAVVVWTTDLVAAQSDIAAQMQNNTPQCAAPCTTQPFLSGVCSVDAIASCICSNVTLQAQLSECTQKSCGLQDQLKAVALQTQLCAGYPQESRSDEIRILNDAFSAIVFSIVALRLGVRLYTFRSLAADDYVFLVAVVAAATGAGIEYSSTSMGFGKHYWQVNPANGEALLRDFWILQLLYIIVMVFSKMSILIFLARIFSTPGFILAAKLFGLLLVVHGVIFFFVDAFQCVPVQSIWDLSIPPTHCVDLLAMSYTGGAFNIAEDVVLLVLPIHWVWQLQMPTRKRIAILIMFGLGSLVSVTSIVRLFYVVKFSHSFDSTWDNVDVIVWSIIDKFTALLCAALPGLWPLFKGIPRLVSKHIVSSISSQNNSNAKSDTLSKDRAGVSKAEVQDNWSGHIESLDTKQGEATA